MKNFWFILLILMMLQACGSSTNQFTIEGKLENANGENLTLLELQMDGVKTLDSLQLDKEGKFKFTGYTESAKFYIVRTSPRNTVTLIVEPGDHITLEGNAGNLTESYTLSGSEASENILDIRKKHRAMLEKLDSLSKIYKDNPHEEKTDDLKKRLSKVSQSIIQKHRAFTKNFIDQNINSLAILMALYQQIGPRSYLIDPREDFSYYEKVDSALMAQYPNSEAVKSFHSQVENLKSKMGSEGSSGDEKLAVGKTAPEIALPNPKGDTVKLSSLQGNYVLLDFWASWCKPCRVENPILVQNYQRFKDKEFEIYQVSLDRNRSDWLQAIEKDNLNWYHVSDLAFWNSKAAEKYNVRSIPANFLLNKKGEIIAKNLRGDDLQAKLHEVLSD